MVDLMTVRESIEVEASVKVKKRTLLEKQHTFFSLLSR